MKVKINFLLVAIENGDAKQRNVDKITTQLKSDLILLLNQIAFRIKNNRIITLESHYTSLDYLKSLRLL